MSAENKPITDPQGRSLEEDVPELIIEEIDSRGVARLGSRESISVSQFSGPVPPPALMKEYAEIDPDFPKRLFEIAERQQMHDHAVEKDIIATNKAIAHNHQTLERWGQIFGFILALIGLGTGIAALLSGSPIAGSIFGTGGLTLLAGVFVYNSRKNVSSPQPLSPTPQSPPPSQEGE